MASGRQSPVANHQAITPISTMSMGIPMARNTLYIGYSSLSLQLIFCCMMVSMSEVVSAGSSPDLSSEAIMAAMRFRASERSSSSTASFASCASRMSRSTVAETSLSRKLRMSASFRPSDFSSSTLRSFAASASV